MKKYLFLDRDGTLIIEPESKQINSISEIALLPDVITALTALQNKGYVLVMVSNQDGLGTTSYSVQNFDEVQQFLLAIFASQGIKFETIRICPHIPEDNCFCRKPKPGLLLDYLASTDWDRSSSYVIGDRETDMEFALSLGVKGLKIDRHNVHAWSELKDKILAGSRTAECIRKTNETNVFCAVNLDVDKPSKISTGNFFFDHMLEQLAKHAGIYLDLKVEGDLQIDDHHTVEDAAIVLGQTFKKALGAKIGIGRYGFVLPMDESLATVSIDLAGRAYLKFEGVFTRDSIGGFATEMVKHFFKSLSDNLQAVFHISVIGENTHHQIEAIFKGVGQALRMAINGGANSLPTTKGLL